MMRPGLTIIELMVTLVIVSSLTAAALSVSVATVRSMRLAEATGREFGVEGQLASLLEADLTHAYQYRRIEHGVELRTYARLNESTKELEHLPATVTYAVREIQGRNFLVRTQISGPEAIRDTELLLSDVDMFGLCPSRDSKGKLQGDWVSLPERVDVIVQRSLKPGGAIALRVRVR